MSIRSLVKVTAPLMVLVCLQCGCASVGRNFKYQNRDSLELGQTRSSDYRNVFGRPSAVEVRETSDGKFESVRYLYAYADVATARSRLLDLEFRDEVLNAYYYMSSFDEDRTLVDPDQLKQIQRGISRQEDVVQILGKPHGRVRCPTCHVDFKDKCGKGTEIWAWATLSKLPTFGAAYAGRQVETRTIFVTFDKDGIVTDVESSQTKNP